MSFLSLDHDFLGKLMRTVIVAFTVSSMTYELILAGRNCYPQSAKMFAEREIRLQLRNGTVWFPLPLNSYGSQFVITILQILFVMISLAITIATVTSNKKRIYKKTRRFLRLRKNSVVPKSKTNVKSVRKGKKDTSCKGNTLEKQKDNKITSKEIINSSKVSNLSPHQETCSGSSLTAIEVISDVAFNKPTSANFKLPSKNTSTSTFHPKTNSSESLSEQFVKVQHSQTMSAKSLHLEQILLETIKLDVNTKNIRFSNVVENEGDTKSQSWMYKMASSTSAIIIYNFILLKFFFELKDSPRAVLVGYSYFKAVFDTIPLFVILTKDPIFDLVKRRIQTFSYSNMNLEIK